MRRFLKYLASLAPYIAWLYFHLVLATSRLNILGMERIKRRSILASWHSLFSIPVFLLRKRKLLCIVSPSADGRLLGKFLTLSGCKVILGSSRRGGISAFRQAKQALAQGEILGITPDGPLGPPRIPKKGILLLTDRDTPIIPVGVAISPALRLPTWDRHLLPLPFSKIIVSFGKPFYPQGDLNSVKQALDREEEKAKKLLIEDPRPSRWRLLIPILLYNIAIFLLLPFILGWFFLRQFGGKKLRGWKEKMGLAPRGEGAIWVHAVSVGETMAAKPIVENLKRLVEEKEIYLSVTTTTGMETAKRHLRDLAKLFYFPLDIFPCPLIALRRLKPRVIALVETEVWPNLIFWARLLNIPLLLVNGRISDDSLVKMRALKFFFAPLLEQMTLFMQSERDAKRAFQSGGRNVKVVGNSKFDQVALSKDLSKLENLKNLLKIEEDEEILVAGSTHPGEEEMVLDAYWNARLSFPHLRLILAPRHPERMEEVESLLSKRGFTYVKRSRLPLEALDKNAVILIDTVGELFTLYGLCTVAFVGGSLVPKGGHNILEPLAWGKPVLFGPYMHNFRDITDLAKQAEVGIEVRNSKELSEKVKALLGEASLRKEIAKSAERLIETMQGASKAYAQAIAELASKGT